MTRNHVTGPLKAYSLSRRAALAQIIIIAAVVLCFSVAIIAFNTYRLNKQLEDQIASVSRLAETSLASAVWQVDHASARDFIDAVLQDDSVAFAQVITGREVMASKSRTRFAGQPFSFFKNDGKFLTKTVEIKKFGDWIGTFNLAITTERIRHEIYINIGGTILLAIVLILAISQTTFYFARKNLFTPLKRLEESATAIADGDLDAVIDTSALDELGNLARAFDDMRESVRHLIGDLKDANAKLENHRNVLESTVKDRTEELRLKNISLNQALEEVRKAKKSADTANIAKSHFLASMSHEIRTPMNAILGMADILWETELTDDQERYVQVFRTAGESLLAILNDILDLSKIEAGHLALEATTFNLNEAIDKTCSVIEPKANQKQLDFACTIAPNVPSSLIGDPTRLKQILINLLGNAVKFTSSGSVHLSVERMTIQGNETTLQFSISDTGMGIPTDKLGSIFDSFTQADSSTTREFGGTGLGLAISKRLVRMMGGRIWVESTPGKGSIFNFTARFDISKVAAPKSEAVIVYDQPELPKANILMLEDSKYNAFVIQTYLKNTPCRLTVAENGQEGFDQFKTGDWDIVLMDIQMPIMDGYEATRLIREYERNNGLSRMPIVAMTAYALVGDAEKCLAAGADRHLPKPVKKSSLFEMLNELVETGQQRVPVGTENIFSEVQDIANRIISTVEDALGREDYPAITILGQELSDNGDRLEQPDVTNIGRSLSVAGNSSDPVKVNEALAALAECIEGIDRV